MNIQNTGRFVNLLAGSYTDSSDSYGIHVYDFDLFTGECKLKTRTEVENPSWLAVSPDGKNVYSVNESIDGGVSSFSFDQYSGELTFINRVSSGGSEPCHITADKEKNYVFAGNYESGSLSVIAIKADGSLDSDIFTIRYEGSGIDEIRQKGPHVHCTVISPDNQWLFVTDLGTDRVYICRFEGLGKHLREELTFISVKEGSGPRLLLFHPDSVTVYLIHEMGGFITVYDFNYGKLELKQNISLLSPGYEGEISASDIQISPDARYLYASNRGDANEIVVFSIEKKGLLRIKERYSSMGKTPRNLAIEPSGNFLLAANQDSNEIVVYKRDLSTGLLSLTDNRIAVRQPVFLKFI